MHIQGAGGVEIILSFDQMISYVYEWNNFNKNYICFTLFQGPTICYDAMEHVEVTGVVAKDADATTPIVFEITPDADQEQVVEIEVTGLEEDEKPTILKPTEDLADVSTIRHIQL